MRALARAGLELAGPLGNGADGPRPVARDAEGRGWAVTVLGPGTMPRAELRARVRALTALEHPHVAAVAPLVELRDGSAVALQAEVVGPDLATVARARGPWRPGEVVTLVVPLAQALAALHDAGVAHGDVSPGNVVLERDGRPVLVDLVCGARPAEVGTPGLAAPERPRGAEPAGDVHALGRLGLALLGDPSDDARRREPGRASVRAVLEAACSADPAARPGAAELAERVYAACAAEPVGLPDAAVLARLTLRRLAAPPEDATVVRPDLAPASRRARHRRTSRARGPAVVAAVGLVVAGAFVALERSDGAFAGHSAPVADAEAVAVPTVAPRAGAALGDPLGAAVRLTVRRAEALGARDAVALASVSVPGSAAARADAALAGALWRRTPSGGAAVVEEVHLLSLTGPGPGLPREARVLVRSRAQVSTPAGGSGDAPAVPGAADEAEPAAASEVVLVLEEGPAGWRVSAVERAPAA